MSSATPTSEKISQSTTKPQRVLSCVLCQQRKVRCDRKFPCANCIKSGVHCISAVLAPRQRHRRFPERELLERLRRYEDLLRQNNIDFEPLHPPVASPSGDSHQESTSTLGSDPGDKNVKNETIYEAKNYWQLMNQMSLDSEDEDEGEFTQDDVRDTVLGTAWHHAYGSDYQYLLFGSRQNIHLSTFHPEQVHIFKLWQIYLENVNPLLKVTHTPTLQARIIGAASNLATVDPTLEALMFGIYCISVRSLDVDQCFTLFRFGRDELLRRFRVGCQQALLNCNVLRSSNGECLAALYLYLVSIRSDADPWSLSSMLGVAIRLAQRIGIHNESTYARYTALEGEMYRRLWWSLVLFDHRTCEVSDQKATMLAPTWDCKTPLNVNDFDLQPEMKSPPTAHEKPTEALFAVVSSELGNFLRFNSFHLDFINPSLKTIAKDVGHLDKLVDIEKTMEDKHLRFCNLENPLHFMTIWTTRGSLARCHLLDHYARYSDVRQTDKQRDTAVTYALRMLECDTMLMTSPLAKGFLWRIQSYFPFPAYIHLVQDLKKRPSQERSRDLWKVMSDNYRARFNNMDSSSSFFIFFSRLVLQAWKACTDGNSGTISEAPLIVLDVQKRMQVASDEGIESQRMESVGHEYLIPSHDLLYGTQEGSALGLTDGPTRLGMDMTSDWTTIGWHPMTGHGW